VNLWDRDLSIVSEFISFSSIGGRVARDRLVLIQMTYLDEDKNAEKSSGQHPW
jgi:hypothetical protein